MLSGSPGDYDAAARASIKTILAAESDVSTNAVSLTLIAGSVLVNADIYFGTQAGATYAASALSTGVLADATTLQATLNARFAADGLGITTTVQELRSAPQAVVQGPSPSPSQPPIDVTSFSVEAPSDSSGMGIVFGAGVGGAVIGLLVLLFCCFVRRKKTAVTPLHPEAELVAPMPRMESMEAQLVPVQEGVPLAVAVIGSGETQERTLVEMSDLLKGQLKLSGSVAQVVTAACEELGVATEGKPLVQKAHEACAALGM